MTIPIFPLPQSILFPGIYVPFHIFEERYKLMLKKIEASGSVMAVSYAPELSPEKFYPHMVCGAGQVRVLKRYDTGESDILVYGTKRVKFHRYVQEVPYLIGEGEVLETDRDMPKETEGELLKGIKEMLINWIFSNFDDASRPIQFFKTVSDLEPLCNFVAYYFISDIEKKQRLLEEDRLENKAQVIWQVLRDMDAAGSEGPKAMPLIFPGSSGKKTDDNNYN